MPIHDARALTVALLLTLAAAAASPPAAAETSGRYDLDAPSGAWGPAIPPLKVEPFPPLDAETSCEDVYREITRLEPWTRTRRPSFYDEPLNLYIGMVGAMWEPAFWAWIGSEVLRFMEDRHIRNAKQRIVALRALSADKYCWVY